MTTSLLGQMMDVPLTVSSLLAHASRHFGTTEIVSKRIEGDVHRYTYRDCEKRAKQLAQALIALDVQPGERIGTLAWNGYRHLEAYYGTTGFGAICHTINPRLFPEQIAWIINDANDSYVLFDTTFAQLIDYLAPLCPKVRGWIAFADDAHLPAVQTPIPLISYETLLNPHDGAFDWPLLDERQASYLCYTSGTTGNPKGALYSHRSTVLHAYAGSLPDAMCLSARDSVLPVVPMFHANAWGIPHAAPLTGAKLVLPGKDLDGKSLFELMQAERVTYSSGVPTVWLGLLNYMKEAGVRLSSLQRVAIGGSACPPAMLRSFEEYGIEAIHGWGMTEMSPLGTLATLNWEQSQRPPEEQRRLREKQGHVIYGVDMKIVGDDGRDLPWDGVAFGELHTRGPWVIKRYFQKDDSPLVDGWFPTGDVATIDRDGFMRITDRNKDVIKSGGEWISSIEIENIAIAHPAVAEAACIACAHPKWAQRPLLVVVKRKDAEVTRDELLAFYEGKVAKWWMPDDVVFVNELPHTAVGKLHKLKLREQFSDHLLPSALEVENCPLADERAMGGAGSKPAAE
ncbi:3-(methylthio)propionyl-CoA ligase [Paraburkholderia fungorum]|uniref:3-(methylthio)propionyl-CoA ligase n=1 Tax=Paraburkholderia fungorum TaxID=134537 RepID=UPI0038BB708D